MTRTLWQTSQIHKGVIKLSLSQLDLESRASFLSFLGKIPNACSPQRSRVGQEVPSLAQYGFRQRALNLQAEVTTLPLSYIWGPAECRVEAPTDFRDRSLVYNETFPFCPVLLQHGAHRVSKVITPCSLRSIMAGRKVWNGIRSVDAKHFVSVYLWSLLCVYTTDCSKRTFRC